MSDLNIDMKRDSQLVVLGVKKNFCYYSSLITFYQKQFLFRKRFQILAKNILPCFSWDNRSAFQLWDFFYEHGNQRHGHELQMRIGSYFLKNCNNRRKKKGYATNYVHKIVHISALFY